MTTENEFYAYVKKVCLAHGITAERDFGMVGLWAAENGSDCGADCWRVAMASVDEAVDQGLLHKVAQYGTAY